MVIPGNIAFRIWLNIFMTLIFYGLSVSNIIVFNFGTMMFNFMFIFDIPMSLTTFIALFYIQEYSN